MAGRGGGEEPRPEQSELPGAAEAQPRAVGRGSESAVRSKCSSFSLQTLKLPQVKEPHKAVSTHGAVGVSGGTGAWRVRAPRMRSGAPGPFAGALPLGVRPGLLAAAPWHPSPPSGVGAATAPGMRRGGAQCGERGWRAAEQPGQEAEGPTGPVPAGRGCGAAAQPAEGGPRRGDGGGREPAGPSWRGGFLTARPPRGEGRRRSPR